MVEGFELNMRILFIYDEIDIWLYYDNIEICMQLFLTMTYRIWDCTRSCNFAVKFLSPWCCLRLTNSGTVLYCTYTTATICAWLLAEMIWISEYGHLFTHLLIKYPQVTTEIFIIGQWECLNFIKYISKYLLLLHGLKPIKQFVSSYYKDKTVSWPFYLYHGNPCIRKGRLYIETRTTFSAKTGIILCYQSLFIYAFDVAVFHDFLSRLLQQSNSLHISWYIMFIGVQSCMNEGY